MDYIFNTYKNQDIGKVKYILQRWINEHNTQNHKHDNLYILITGTSTILNIFTSSRDASCSFYKALTTQQKQITWMVCQDRLDLLIAHLFTNSYDSPNIYTFMQDQLLCNIVDASNAVNTVYQTINTNKPNV